MHNVPSVLTCTCIHILEMNCKQLSEAVFGMVVCRNGSPLCLSGCQDNYFIHAMDALVIDRATNCIVYEGQKPLGLFVKLVQLYSCEGDWTYYAPSGVGKYLLICPCDYMDDSIVGIEATQLHVI